MTTRTILIMALLVALSTPAQSKDVPAIPADFNFLLGDYVCSDVFTTLDGQRETLRATQTAHYILGGAAIQDHYQNARFNSTNLRIYDAETQRWKVTYFREPGGVSGTWSGVAIDGTIQLERSFQYNGEPALSRLTFDSITADTYTWRSEYRSGDRVFVDWTSTCQRQES